MDVSVCAGAPSDSFYGNGLMGQRVIVVPSQDLVIVRLGLNYNDDFDQAWPPPLIPDIQNVIQHCDLYMTAFLMLTELQSAEIWSLRLVLCSC